MENRYLLALDAGSGSVRAVLFDTKGNQVGCVQKEWTHSADPRFPGSMNFDWEWNWRLTCECIRGVLAETGVSPTDIAGLSTTCMREGIVLYNDQQEEIWACANVDSRSNQEVVELLQLDPNLEKEIYNITGEVYALGALPRLLWVKNKMPELYNNVRYMGMFNDWLIHKLTGVLAVEPSNGSTTGVLNLKTRNWIVEVAEKCGLRTNIFPPIKECGTIAGTVNEKGTLDTGLALGTLVVVGGGDAQLGCIGVGLVDQGKAAVFGGSFWQYEYNIREPITDPQYRLRVNCHAVPDMWQYEAIAFNPGLVMRWYRDAFCQLEAKESATTGISVYELMNKEAEKVPAGCNGVLCAFSDIMNFVHWQHAAPTFTNFGLDADKFNRFTFYRAIMENAAMVTKGHYNLVAETTGDYPQEVVFAGGASKSALWCQILADVLNVPVKVPIVKEATALGAAILAGYGVGIYKNISKTVEELIRWDKIYHPTLQNQAVYRDLYSKWQKVYSAQLQLVQSGVTNSMWSAPGLS